MFRFITPRRLVRWLVRDKRIDLQQAFMVQAYREKHVHTDSPFKYFR